MMLYDNSLYIEDIEHVSNLKLPWNKLSDTSVIISGASGLIGSFLIDVIMKKNEMDNLNCHVYAIVRDKEKSEKRFGKYNNSELFDVIVHDINEKLYFKKLRGIDYVLHLASNTHPLSYSTDPISTITTNVIGTKNMLDFALEHNCTRFAFASSNEIYGENRGDVEFFDENYCGYINSNTLRAGYPESKRCGEALCQAYISQKGMDIVIPRLTRTYGPTLLKTDTKALSQFIKNAFNGENIVLKSEGNQYYSYTYVADAVSGLLTVLLLGKCGEAYNISDEKSDIKLKELANIIANIANTKVVYELPNKLEAKGYSLATKARLSNKKISLLGWVAAYSIHDGINRTISILRKL